MQRYFDSSVTKREFGKSSYVACAYASCTKSSHILVDTYRHKNTDKNLR